MDDSHTARLLFSGPFGDDHRARALDALGIRWDGGARDILYITATPAARRMVVAELVRRRRAVFGVRVVTLRSLPAELARRARVTEPEPIDDAIDGMLVERELRAATGGRFDDAVPVHGLVATATSTIDLLERNGATPGELATLLSEESFGEGAAVLARAWGALAVRRARYGATNAGRLAWAQGLLREHAAVLAGLDLLVLDDLPLLGAVECEIVRSLVAAAPRDVLAVHGYAPPMPNAPTSRSLARLRELADWTERSAAAAPGHGGLSTRLFAVPAPAARGDGAADGESARQLPRITLLEAAGDLGEVRLAARVVRRHLDAGVQPEEIALVVHASARRYRELVREVFDGAGIPVGVPLPRTLADTGIGAVLLQLLALAIRPAAITREASLAVVRTPHLNVPTREADRLERHVVNHGFLGLDGWDELAAATLGERTANRINRLKRAVAGARAAFATAATPHDAARAVRQMARELRLVGNAYFARRRWIRGEGGDASLASRTALAVREDNQAWEAIGEVLDETVPAMLEIAPGIDQGPGLAWADRWLTLLERALRAVAVTAERAPAHAVQFRHTGAACDATARVTIVLGLVEKVFPRQARQNPFLSDALRVALRARFGWDLSTTAEATEREREAFLRAVSSARDALYLAYPATDDEGRPAVRSFFIDDLRAALGAGHPVAVEHSGSATAVAHVADAVSSSELLAAVSHDVWQHLGGGDEAAGRRAAAFRVLAALGTTTDVSAVRHGRRVSQRPVLHGVLPPTAPHLTLELSASQLKTVSHCTYRHFVDKVLTPEAIVPPEYNALEKGSLIHEAVMEWSTTLRGWERGEEALADLDRWIQGRIDGWSAAKRGAERTATATASDRERLDRLLRRELELLKRPGVAHPLYAELAFGDQPNARGPHHPASRAEPFDMEVPTSKGPVTVKFRGSMDRVDVVTVDGRPYGVVIDYKTGRTSSWYAKDMLRGTDLQLRLYLLVLHRFWGIMPVGALYFGFGDGIRRGAVRADFANRVAGLDDPAAVEQKAVKLLEPDEWLEFVNETPSLIAPLVDRLVRLDITPAPRDHDCGFCDFASICRYERWGAAE